MSKTTKSTREVLLTLIGKKHKLPTEIEDCIRLYSRPSKTKKQLSNTHLFQRLIKLHSAYPDAYDSRTIKASILAFRSIESKYQDELLLILEEIRTPRPQTFEWMQLYWHQLVLIIQYQNYPDKIPASLNHFLSIMYEPLPRTFSFCDFVQRLHSYHALFDYD